MNRILTCVAAASLFAAVGCANQKKMAEPNAVADNTPPAAAPVPYQPTASAAQPAVTATPTETATPAAMTDGSAAPVMTANGTHSKSMVASSGHKYTIKQGDNLYKIAKAKYGNGNDYKKILAANPGLNENRLIPGKTIVLP